MRMLALAHEAGGLPTMPTNAYPPGPFEGVDGFGTMYFPRRQHAQPSPPAEPGRGSVAR
jgi:hypothetical protein